MADQRCLILGPRHGPDSQALWRAAIERGWGVERLANWRAEIPVPLEAVTVYGEPLFALALAQRAGLALVEPREDFLALLEHRFRGRQVALMSPAEARHVPDRRFFKPAADKTFRAGLYDSGLAVPEAMADASAILVSEPVKFSVEFRCFVGQRMVETLSPYLRDGVLVQSDDGHWPATPDEFAHARTFAQRVLDETALTLPPGFVLDVGLTADRGWVVIEANTAWGAGIYGCDPDKILNVLARTCMPASAVPVEVAQFVRQ